jgi:hypothetical protein
MFTLHRITHGRDVKFLRGLFVWFGGAEQQFSTRRQLRRSGLGKDAHTGRSSSTAMTQAQNIAGRILIHQIPALLSATAAAAHTPQGESLLNPDAANKLKALIAAAIQRPKTWR